VYNPASYLPEHWQAWLRAYRPRWNGSLSAYDFKRDEEVRLRFTDGSQARFVASFCAVDEERGELAVFTEHCRYHVFTLGGLEWEGRVALLHEGAV
jgi:hypothetical protein